MSPVRSRRVASGAGQVGRLLLLVAAVAGGAFFAVMGGEYSTFDLLRQRQLVDSLQTEVVVLRQTVDSLAAWKAAIENDPAVQERLARENFGMVRGDKELLYRFRD
jgi:cell division protein FtsB